MSHIALLLPELEAGGAQRVMLLLAREFAARGHRVDLVLLCAAGPLLSAVPEGVHRVDLAARSHGLGQLGFSLSSIWRLAAWMKQERPDAMLSTITGANLVGLVARKIAGVPLRLVIRETVTLNNVTSALRLWAMRWLYPQADAVIALSVVMAEELTQQLCVSTTRIHCIANPVDAAYVREQSRQPLTHPWLDDDGLRVVISAGRLVPQKDYPTLLRAFAMTTQEALARLIIVGEGPEHPILEQLMMELKIANRVHLVGFDPNPWRWMARADLFVLSSKFEGRPNALLEALAVGLPAVVTEYDASVRDMAQQYRFATVRIGDSATLARQIFKQLAKPREITMNVTHVEDTAADYLEALGCAVSLNIEHRSEA